jgi:hypothetical protein
MLFDKKYDDKEIECKFCHKKVKPIIEKNKLVPGPFFSRVGPGSAKKPHRYILICPNCKAIIGTKN